MCYVQSRPLAPDSMPDLMQRVERSLFLAHPELFGSDTSRAQRAMWRRDLLWAWTVVITRTWNVHGALCVWAMKGRVCAGARSV